MSEEIQKPSLNSGLAFKGLLTLAIMLLMSLFLCIVSVVVYIIFFWGKPFLSPTELSVLLDSPSTLAFQVLMNALAYLFTIIWCVNNAQVSFQTSLNLLKTNYISLVESIFIIISASILIDQFLYVIADIAFSGLEFGNLAGNLNIASILGNIQDNNFIIFNLLLFLTVVFTPVVEELFFRGFLWKTLRNNFSFFQTLFISSFCFAIIHFDFIQGINAFLISLVYGFIVEKNKSVWPCVVAHVTCSFMTYLLSQKGLSYGVGGVSYPQLMLLISSLIFVISFVLIFSKDNLLNSSKK